MRENEKRTRTKKNTQKTRLATKLEVRIIQMRKDHMQEPSKFWMPLQRETHVDYVEIPLKDNCEGIEANKRFQAEQM